MRRRPVRLVRVSLVAVWLLAAACAGPADREAGAFEAAHPELARFPGQRLRETRAYPLPVAGELVLFLCRWRDGAPIPVAFPPDASPEERRALQMALAAWEGAGLGVRFEARARLENDYGIEIRLIDGMLGAAANTIADCAAGPAPGPQLPAGLVFASIHLGRGDPRLLGSALHELGHALGFQGHPRGGDTLMRGGAKLARVSGERVKSGVPLRDTTLQALYALPPGLVVARRALPAGRSLPVDRLLERGGAAGWAGPFVRVGDTEGLISWRDPAGRIYSITLRGLASAANDPARLTLEPDPNARTELDRITPDPSR